MASSWVPWSRAADHRGAAPMSAARVAIRVLRGTATCQRLSRAWNGNVADGARRSLLLLAVALPRP